ncbi:flagellar basal body P-ring formation chaperone FlgA [Magnetospirillum molischianum]|uniref:Flagellar basal body P-ring biosynthesis protein n=1 Tax=Magnetospirillum molischianum DSM 120 TaxID=1150626 RepID=H8FPS1_MAGML|nr:flagellar basal body P-ring formation chaperone FlgA [Magnetospirillum molischianum]CCG40359.1 Flagellar basal body P-ring biosynthesis protein [Magnetospirillum molischianum DSM 120]
MTSLRPLRLIAALALLATMACGGAVAAGTGTGTVAALPPQLRPAVTLEADVIRLGDLWENAGEKAEVPLAKAPEPGKHITLEARWLAAVANAYNLDWRPATPFDRTTIERAGRTIDIRAVETELREALSLEGAPAGANIELSNRGSLRILVPVNTDQTIGIRDLNYDPRMNRFSAVVEVPAGAANATRFKVNGSVFASARIPVLAHPMARGEVIAENDIEWVEVREEVVRRDVVTTLRQVVGQEPRYPLRAGAPIRTAEIQKPISVAKNSAVTIIVRTPFMVLSAQGRATEDGSVGDVIRVTNAQSKQVVDARVEGPGQVSVIPAGQRAQAY